MSLLLISLYEFGQFLRILLWIFIPLVIVSMLVTTFLHYRRKRRLPEDLELLLSFEGLEGSEGLLAAAKMTGNGREAREEGSQAPKGEAEEPEDREKIYKGILWMKEKYEQYRDMADRRYEELKEELSRTEKKYQDLLESGVRPAGETPESGKEGPLSEVEQASYPDMLEEKNQHIAFLQQQLDNRIKIFHQLELDGRENKNRLLQLEEIQLRTGHLLQEKQAYIDQLEGQLVAERRKIDELVNKLQASSQQLLAIYQELDRSMKPAGTADGQSGKANASGEPLNSPSE
ncbi:hypothetical protein [Puia dinghuensis]|nr:hypothetical protein [Puia dinghuensis]